MKKLLAIVITMGVLGVLAMSGFGYETVPPAHKGRILSSAGYEPEILPPGRTHVGWNEKLILLETGTGMMREPMGVILADKMELPFDVRVRVRIGSSNLKAMFDDVPPQGGRIDLARVYQTYGQMLVRNISRSVVSKYTVDDVASNYSNISAELYEQLSKAFEGTPLQLSDAAMGNIRYPEVVTAAVDKAKARQMQIEETKAQERIDLIKKQKDEKLAEADYRIRMIKAKTIRDENRLVSEGVTEKYLKYRQLEVMEKMAENGSAVFMPYEAINTIGAQNRMFSK